MEEPPAEETWDLFEDLGLSGRFNEMITESDFQVGHVVLGHTAR